MISIKNIKFFNSANDKKQAGNMVKAELEMTISDWTKFKQYVNQQFESKFDQEPIPSTETVLVATTITTEMSEILKPISEIV